MSFKPFPIIYTEDKDLARTQVNISTTLEPIIKNARLDSRTLQSLSLLNTGINIVPHTLNRNVVGWSVVDKDTPSEIWSMQKMNPLPNKNLWLLSSNNCTINLEVW
jgi:hypothetical protein